MIFWYLIFMKMKTHSSSTNYYTLSTTQQVASQTSNLVSADCYIITLHKLYSLSVFKMQVLSNVKIHSFRFAFAMHVKNLTPHACSKTPIFHPYNHSGRDATPIHSNLIVSMCKLYTKTHVTQRIEKEATTNQRKLCATVIIVYHIITIINSSISVFVLYHEWTMF